MTRWTPNQSVYPRTRVAMILVAVMLVPARAAEPSRSLTARDEPGEIEQLVADLAHPSYEKRTFATRRLCAIGMPARAALDQASASGNAEQSLRAEAILEAIDRLLFAGVELELALSRSEIAWDDSVDLTVILTNRSPFPARVPFELDESARAQQTGDARQVADLIDVAEWLIVIFDGRDARSLHVDDITADPAISNVVHARVENAPHSMLAPGQRVEFKAMAINRGWARYPLLDRGRYQMMLKYVPEWKDEMLAAAKVGSVVSNAVELVVTRSAPESISRRGAEASLELTRDGEDYVVQITNRRDQPVFVNANFGPAAPFAQGRWVCERGDTARDVAMIPKPIMDESDFSGQRLVLTDAGAAVELVRMNRAELHGRFRWLGLDPDSDDASLYFSYSNQCDRAWQLRQERTTTSAPSVLGDPLPRRMLTGWHTSHRLRVHQARDDR